MKDKAVETTVARTAEAAAIHEAGVTVTNRVTNSSRSKADRDTDGSNSRGRAGARDRGSTAALAGTIMYNSSTDIRAAPEGTIDDLWVNRVE